MGPNKDAEIAGNPDDTERMGTGALEKAPPQVERGVGGVVDHLDLRGVEIRPSRGGAA